MTALQPALVCAARHRPRVDQSLARIPVAIGRNTRNMLPPIGATATRTNSLPRRSGGDSGGIHSQLPTVPDSPRRVTFVCVPRHAAECKETTAGRRGGGYHTHAVYTLLAVPRLEYRHDGEHMRDNNDLRVNKRYRQKLGR